MEAFEIFNIVSSRLENAKLIDDGDYCAIEFEYEGEKLEVFMHHVESAEQFAELASHKTKNRLISNTEHSMQKWIEDKNREENFTTVFKS